MTLKTCICLIRAHSKPQGQSQLDEHKSCTSKVAINMQALTDSHAVPNTHVQCNHMEMDEKLDLSLGYHGFLTNVCSVEHSVTNLVDDQSKNPIVAEDLCCKSSKEEACPSNNGFTSSYVVNQTLPHANGVFPSSLHDDKVFFCKFCDRQFHSSQALGGHQNAHKRERLVARSTPRLRLPLFSCSPPRSFAIPPLSNQPCPMLPLLPSYIGGDRSKAFPLVAVGHHEEIRPMLGSSILHKERFQAPPHGLPMYKTSSARDYMRNNNVYNIGNRSLGIKAHSLVHKSAGAQGLHVSTSQTGHMRCPVGWPRMSIVGRAGVAGAFAADEDHSQHGSMQMTAERFGDTCLYSATPKFVCRIEGSDRLLQHQQCYTRIPLAHESSCTKSYTTQPCISPLLSYELDSCTRNPCHVDLALHL